MGLLWCSELGVSRVGDLAGQQRRNDLCHMDELVN